VKYNIKCIYKIYLIFLHFIFIYDNKYLEDTFNSSPFYKSGKEGKGSVTLQFVNRRQNCLCRIELHKNRKLRLKGSNWKECVSNTKKQLNGGER